jgi:cytochrome c peroxidase
MQRPASFPKPARTAISAFAVFTLLAALEAVATPAIQLSDRCPPSFEQSGDGTCRLRTLYEAYIRIEGHGGVQTALPPLRQGYTPQQIDLGRHLFYDPLLSANRRNACASCHQAEHGYSDGVARAVGLDGTRLPRRTPTLWNVGFATRLFWDGRAATLEDQAAGPLFAPHEMGNTPASLLQRLSDVPSYQRLFAEAFSRPQTASAITVNEVARSLAAFESTLISLNSRYDRYVHGDRGALGEQELRGMNVFRGFVARCSQCHTPPLFTNNELAVIGSPAAPGLSIDVGAGINGDPLLRGAFKVPTLRNVTKSGPPYFHAGQLGTLQEAVDFYNDRRGHALPRGERQTVHWHVHMMSRQLEAADVEAIVAFLGALEDESMSPPPPAAVPSGLPVPGPHRVNLQKLESTR